MGNGHVKVRFFATEFSTLIMALYSEFSTLTPNAKPHFGTLELVVSYLCPVEELVLLCDQVGPCEEVLGGSDHQLSVPWRDQVIFHLGHTSRGAKSATQSIRRRAGHSAMVKERRSISRTKKTTKIGENKAVYTFCDDPAYHMHASTRQPGLYNQRQTCQPLLQPAYTCVNPCYNQRTHI